VKSPNSTFTLCLASILLLDFRKTFVLSKRPGALKLNHINTTRKYCYIIDVDRANGNPSKDCKRQQTSVHLTKVCILLGHKLFHIFTEKNEITKGLRLTAKGASHTGNSPLN